MRSWLVVLSPLLLEVAYAGCSLNPQPLPPDQSSDAGTSLAVPVVEDAGHGKRGIDAAVPFSGGSGGGAADAGARADAHSETPGTTASSSGAGSVAYDGGVAADASPRVDAASDARAEGSIPDGSMRDAVSHDAELDARASDAEQDARAHDAAPEETGVRDAEPVKDAAHDGHHPDH
jgi:hypothetical protein